MTRLLAAAGLALILTSCGPATCDKLRIVRQNHPTSKKPARRYLFKCGKAETVVDVERPPACLESCYK